MRVVRLSSNTKLALEIDSESERQLVERVFSRGLNTWEPESPMLLAAYQELKKPLMESPGTYREPITHPCPICRAPATGKLCPNCQNELARGEG